MNMRTALRRFFPHTIHTYCCYRNLCNVKQSEVCFNNQKIYMQIIFCMFTGKNHIKVQRHDGHMCAVLKI